MELRLVLNKSENYKEIQNELILVINIQQRFEIKFYQTNIFQM